MILEYIFSIDDYSERTVRDIMRTIVGVIAYCHFKNIILSKISMSDFRFDNKGVLKLADLSSAIHINEEILYSMPGMH